MVIDLSTVPLSSLTHEARSMISALLNPMKILPIDGPDQLSRYRDWRGLASLVKITTEGAASINEYPDKTAKVLEIWGRNNDGTAMVDRLLNYLQILDRYDLYEDLLELAKYNKLIVQRNPWENTQVIDVSDNDEALITLDDKLFGRPQNYHAFVLYAEQDLIFVTELLMRLKREGFLVCTEEDLRLGFAGRLDPLSRLITQRCRYVILVCSPDFLRSTGNTFFMNMAQADAIRKKQIKIIPLKYRKCVLPVQIEQYYCLEYKPHDPKNEINFWERLVDSMTSAETIRKKKKINNRIANHSNKNITEVVNNGYPAINVSETLTLRDVPTESLNISNTDMMSNSYPTIKISETLALPDVPSDSTSINKTDMMSNGYPAIKINETVALPDVPTESSSMNSLNQIRNESSSFDAKSLGNISLPSGKKKKKKHVSLSDLIKLPFGKK